MKNEKLVAILEGVIAIIFGILIAVVGVDTAVNVYFAILATVAGSLLLLFVFYLLIKAKKMPLGLTLLGGASLGLGIGLFTGYVNFGVLTNILIVVLLGGGSALTLYGIWFALKINPLYGVFTIALGASLVILTSVYLAVPEFQRTFWIIVGILIAVYGVFTVLYNAINYNKK